MYIDIFLIFFTYESRSPCLWIYIELPNYCIIVHSSGINIQENKYRLGLVKYLSGWKGTVNYAGIQSFIEIVHC